MKINEFYFHEVLIDTAWIFDELEGDGQIPKWEELVDTFGSSGIKNVIQTIATEIVQEYPETVFAKTNTDYYDIIPELAKKKLKEHFSFDEECQKQEDVPESKRRKILLFDKAKNFAIIILTDAPNTAVEDLCRFMDDFKEHPDEIKLYFEDFKRDWNTRVLFDSREEPGFVFQEPNLVFQGSETDLDIIGFDEFFNLSDYSSEKEKRTPVPVSEENPKTLSVQTKYGVIKATRLDDKEYPGISVVFEKEGNGSPGAVISQNPLAQGIELLIYNTSNPDGEPIEIISLYKDKEKQE